MCFMKGEIQYHIIESNSNKKRKKRVADPI